VLFLGPIFQIRDIFLGFTLTIVFALLKIDDPGVSFGGTV
jgi:hypothetical protein